MTAHYIVGDNVEVLQEIPAGSIDTIIGSCPYAWQRDYLDPDDPAKGQEQGMEATPGGYVGSILRTLDACHHALAPHGTMWFNVDDTYAGSGGAGGDYNEMGLRGGQPRPKGSAVYAKGKLARADERAALEEAAADRRRKISRPRDGSSPGRSANGDLFRARAAARRRAPRPGWPLDKGLCALPAALQVALTYGYNPLDLPDLTACRQWAVRNTEVWCKPNPTVGAIMAKLRPSWEPIFVMSPDGRDPFIDIDAVRTPPKDRAARRVPHAVRDTPGRAPQVTNPVVDGRRLDTHPLGAPPQDWTEDSWMGGQTGTDGRMGPQGHGDHPRNIGQAKPDRVSHPLGAPPGDWLEDEEEDILMVALDLLERAWGPDDELLLDLHESIVHPLGDPPSDYQVISTVGFAGAHYATFPPALVTLPIITSPEKVCECGSPFRRRIVCHTCDEEGTWRGFRNCRCRREDRQPKWERTADLVRSCKCGPDAGDRPARILDPWAGSGTTLQVAHGYGREAIGIDLDHRNVDLARQRLGMFVQESTVADVFGVQV